MKLILPKKIEESFLNDRCYYIPNKAKEEEIAEEGKGDFLWSVSSAYILNNEIEKERQYFNN